MRTIKEASETLQTRARKLVQNEVYMNISTLFEDALKGNQEMQDDYLQALDEYSNYYRSNTALEEIKADLASELTEADYEALEKLGYLESYDELYQIDHMIDQGELALDWYPSEKAEEIYDYTALELYESWGVSSWLANKLIDQGEFVFRYGWNYIWQRQTTGQAIAIDYVILAITQDLID